jgi:hypothetical protein
MTVMFGASAVPTAPQKKIPARNRILFRRPNRSDIRPPNRAPKAAPASSDEVTRPSVTGVSPSPPRATLSDMNGRAPAITPVS